MATRLQLYNRMLSTRDELSSDFVESASKEIQKKFFILEEYRLSRRIGLYAPYQNEVRTSLIFEESDRNRKELYFPAARGVADAVKYYRIQDLKELERRENGSMEPTGKQSSLRDINTLDMIVIPGVAYDLAGARIGFGKGFYDTCLNEFCGERIALAYDFQIVSKLPHLSGKGRVDWVITEKRMIRID